MTVQPLASPSSFLINFGKRQYPEKDKSVKRLTVKLFNSLEIQDLFTNFLQFERELEQGSRLAVKPIDFYTSLKIKVFLFPQDDIDPFLSFASVEKELTGYDVSNKDSHYPIRAHYLNFRKKHPYAFNIPHLFSLRIKNPLLSYTSLLKRVSHSFSVPNLDLQAPHTHQTLTGKGASEIFTISYMMYALENAKGQIKLDEADILKLQHEIYNILICDDYTENDFILLSNEVLTKDPDKIFCFSSGFNKHQTFHILWRNYFFTCNRGYGCKPDGTGIKIFTCEDRSLFTPEKLKRLSSRFACTEDSWADDTWTEKAFNLKGHGRIPFKGQTIGNCTWTSLKCALFVFIIIHIGKHEEENLNLMDQARTLKHFYKDIILFDRRLVISEIKHVISLLQEKEEKIFIEQILLRLLQKLKNDEVSIIKKEINRLADSIWGCP